jgi:hypothetical protein
VRRTLRFKKTNPPLAHVYCQDASTLYVWFDIFSVLPVIGHAELLHYHTCIDALPVDPRIQSLVAFAQLLPFQPSEAAFGAHRDQLYGRELLYLS